MRLFLLSFIFSAFSGCAQHSPRVFTFNDIGWTINLPEGFELLDSTSVAARMAKGRQAVESTNGDKMEAMERKQLIIAKKNGSNYFGCSLTPFDEVKDGSWQSTNQKQRELAFETMVKKVPSAQFDSVTTLVTIDSVLFSKFLTVGKQNGKVIYQSIMLGKFYKNSDLNIFYVCVDENIETEIEEMLRQSKFSN